MQRNAAGGASLLLVGSAGKKALVYPFFIFFGIGWGSTAAMFMAAAADLFKGKVFGLIYGLLEGAVGIGAAFGAWVAAPRRAFAGIYGPGQRQKT